MFGRFFPLHQAHTMSADGGRLRARANEEYCAQARNLCHKLTQAIADGRSWEPSVAQAFFLEQHARLAGLQPDLEEVLRRRAA
eukprot:SAG22_NODE_10622_length_524_cov_1.023529_1_plen_82_part_01